MAQAEMDLPSEDKKRFAEALIYCKDQIDNQQSFAKCFIKKFDKKLLKQYCIDLEFLILSLEEIGNTQFKDKEVEISEEDLRAICDKWGVNFTVLNAFILYIKDAKQSWPFPPISISEDDMRDFVDALVKRNLVLSNRDVFTRVIKENLKEKWGNKLVRKWLRLRGLEGHAIYAHPNPIVGRELSISDIRQPIRKIIVNHIEKKGNGFYISDEKALPDRELLKICSSIPKHYVDAFPLVKAFVKFLRKEENNHYLPRLIALP